MSNKLNIKSCPLCEGTNLKPVMTCTDYCTSGETFELDACQDCGFVFTQDFPTEPDIDGYYQSPNYISHNDSSKGLINKVYHAVRRYMLKRKVKLVIKESHLAKGTLLDVGTGTGYFADAMKKKGWEVDAIEKNKEARLYGMRKFGIEIKGEKSLDRFRADKYDVITLWHVMEHLENLNEMWDKFYRLLNEKGILIVAVPNRSSYDAAKYKAQWAAYDVPRHLWHFTPGTMQRFGSKHRFIMKAHEPMPFDAFYISILSEKYRGSAWPVLKGLLTGMSAWFHALLTKDKSSSIIYVFRKK